MKRILSKEGRAKLPPGSFKAGLYAVLSFIVLAVVIITFGSLYYRTYADHFRKEAGRDLLAITELKVDGLSRWRKERMGDGEVFCHNPIFSRLVRQWFDQPEDADARQQLQMWLGKIKDYYHYERVFLLDTQAVERLSIPEKGRPVSDISQHLDEVLRSGKVTFMDFHRHAPDQPIVLGVLVPVSDEADANRPLGILILQIDPAHYLYPFIQSWPIPSETAETLIVRREGNEVLFLNELRFQPNAALQLRIPLTRTDLPAVKAVLGRQGLVTGFDYRNKPVLAAVQAVPDSPWFMVARQDIAEIYAPVKTRLWQSIVMTAILLLGAAAGTGLVWRHQRVRFYREKFEAAQLLFKEQEFQRTLLDNLADGVVACDDNGRLILFNRVAKEWHGTDPLAIPPEEWGKHYNLCGPDGTTPLPSESVPLLRSFRGETLHDIEMSIVANGQPPRQILASSCPFYDDQHNLLGAVAVMHDITRRKLAEDNLGVVMENLRVSNRDLEQFAYIASHDLQEPLRMIANYMQLLERRYKDQLDQDAKDFIGYAVDGAVRMQQLIDSLLEYSRLQTRKHPFESVDLNQVLERVLRDMEGRILETGTQITTAPLPQVVGDAIQFGQVFQNLIGNALKFHGEHPPAIHVSAEEFSNHWKITVRDNGIGIEPDHQKRIFKIFQRLHSRAEYPGTGIGLAICRRIIERHGGETGVESEFNKGSAFWFTLPKKGEK